MFQIIRSDLRCRPNSELDQSRTARQNGGLGRRLRVFFKKNQA